MLDCFIQQLAGDIRIAGQFSLGEVHRDDCVDQALLSAVVHVADDAAHARLQPLRRVECGSARALRVSCLA
jgi:hypothetical protein